MKNLVKHVQNINALHNMWNDYDTIIIGVSGGVDSMCLLDVMLKIAAKEHLSLIVAHVNYGLRGDAADEDQSLVERVSRERGIPCESLRVQNAKGGTEKSWRTMRYEFFELLRTKYGAHKIAVAHNQNDQAETFLLHLLRGSGLTGLVGMRFVSCNYVIRPLLSVMREEIAEYCEKYNITFHTDHTNADVQYTRNRVRMELLPYLQEKYNPRIVTTLARTAEMMGEDAKILEKQIQVFWRKDPIKKKISFSVADFCCQSIGLQRRALLRMVIELCGHTKDIEKGVIDEMRKTILSGKNKNQIFTGKNLKIVRKGDTVICACSA